MDSDSPNKVTKLMKSYKIILGGFTNHLTFNTGIHKETTRNIE